MAEAHRSRVLDEYPQQLIKFKARQLCRRSDFSRSDEDDLIQDLTACLLAKESLYDPARGKWSTFCDRVVRTAVAAILRDRRRLKRGGGQHIQSLDQIVGSGPDGPHSLSEAINSDDRARRVGQTAAAEQDSVELSIDVAEVVAALPPYLQDLCRRLTDGPEASVARDLGVSRRTIRNGKARILERFKQAGFDPKD